MRGRASTLLRLLVVASTLAPSALAHVPEVRPASRDIEDPTRSYAFYDELPPGGEHAWTFALAEGDPLFLHVAVPLGSDWRPEVRLVGPSGDPIPLERLEGVGYEFATPYAARDVWSLDARAPATGRYVLEVSGEGGPYALGYGLRESFTVDEWLGIPVQALRIHAWEGQPPIFLAIPYVAGLAVGAWGAFRARGAGAAAAHPLARLAAGLFLGSALLRGAQMARAAWAGAEGPAWGWAFTAITVALSLLLAWGAWRARRRAAYATLAAGGLLLWSGLLVGPALLVAAAVLPAHTRGDAGRQPRRRAVSR